MLHAGHGLVLEILEETVEVDVALAGLLRDLAFQPAEGEPAPAIRLRIERFREAANVPDGAGLVFRIGDFLGAEYEGEFLIGDGDSLLRLDLEAGLMHACLGPGFLDGHLLRRQQFWGLGIVRMLRSLARYVLHAAALISPWGTSVLVVGPTRSGKSTLAYGLVGKGWRYLSDDAILLRDNGQRVQALAFRKPFSLRPDAATPQTKLRIDLERTHRDQYCDAAFPEVVLFPTIVHSPESHFTPLSPSHALYRFLNESAPPLFDVQTMPAQLATLRCLASQARCFELAAGRDLLHDPEIIRRAVDFQDEKDSCPDCSSN